ncbi:MAG: hypothetical protein WD648_12445 [Planctomycetaceae bacterium]
MASGPAKRLSRVSTRIRRVTTRTHIALSRMQGKRIVHLLHIGKTGGSVIKDALQPHVTAGHYVITLNPHRITLRDVPAGDCVVFFLRDPLTRFVSGFYSRQRKGQPRSYSEWNAAEQEAFAYFDSPNALAVALSARGEAEKARAVRAMQGIRHVADSYWKWFESEEYYLSRLSDIFFVGFQESLAADFETLKARLELPGSIQLTSDPIKSHKNPGHLDYSLDDIAVENLKNWYKNEWRLIRLCQDAAAQGRITVGGKPAGCRGVNEA